MAFKKEEHTAVIRPHDLEYSGNLVSKSLKVILLKQQQKIILVLCWFYIGITFVYLGLLLLALHWYCISIASRLYQYYK